MLTPPVLPTDFPRGPRHGRGPGRHDFALAAPLAAALEQHPHRGRALVLAAWAILLRRHTRQESVGLALAMPEGVGCVELALELSTPASAWISCCASLLASLPCESEPEAPLPAALSMDSEALSDTPHGSDWHLAWPEPNGFRQGTLHYDAALFRAATMERVAGHFILLLEELLRTPDIHASHLPMLTPDEREQLAQTEYGGADAYPLQAVHQAVEAHAAQRPDALAVSFNDTHLSYGELERRANRLAHYLQSRGVGGGMPVALFLDPCLDFPACLLAVLKAGGAHVPLDPAYPTQRLAAILEDTAPRVVLTQTHLRALLPPLPDTVQVLCLEQAQGLLSGYSCAPCPTETALDQPAFIVYTSGTTGRPKGVMMSHGNLIHYLRAAQRRYGFHSGDVFPAIARFSFSITLFEVLSPLLAGGRLILLERAQVLDFKRLVKTLQEATVVHASPSLLRKLVAYLDEQGIGPDAFAQLRHLSFGGDMVPPDLLVKLQRHFPAAEQFVIYGSSEIGCMGTEYPVPRPLAEGGSRVYVGKPFRNVTVRLYDEHGQRVPIGVAGEIHFAGHGLALGYLNRPELTAEKFVTIDGQRFYRSGDVGRLDADGNVEFLGRNDFQIKLRGIRIELAEVETVLREAPGVREAAVALRELAQHEPGLVAYVALSAGGDLHAVHRHLQSKLPDYMLPSAFVVLDALPVNHNLKLDRRALPAPTAADFTRLRSFEPPRTGCERQLAALWESLLDVSPIGVRDNFFEVGGDSLLAVSLLVKIESAFGKAIAVEDLLAHPTVEHLAHLLSSEPQNAVERTIHGAFLSALALGELGIDDDLTGLGASEQQIARALAEIEDALGCRLPADLLREHRTVRALGNLVRRRAARTEAIPLGPDHQGPPLFLVAGVQIYRHLARRLAGRYTCYGVYSGLELLLFESNQGPPPTVAELARDYVECILRSQPEGPYRVAGLSFGGILAYEVAQQLRAAGKEVALVGLFDTMLPESGPWLRWRKLGRLLRLPLREQREALRHGLTRRFRRNAHRPDASAQFARHQDDPALAAMELRREQAYALAAQHYVHQVQAYPGLVVLIVARQRLVKALGRADCGWSPLVQGLTVHHVDADHLSMMEEPTVALVAAALLADPQSNEGSTPASAKAARGDWWRDLLQEMRRTAGTPG